MIDLEKKLAFDDGDNFAEYEEIAEEEQAEDEALEDEAEDEDEALEDDEDSVIFSEDEEDLESEDSLTFSNGVIEKIVAIAMRSVPGVVGMKGGLINRIQDAFGATDEVTPESAVKVNVSVFIEYGAYAPQVFEDVKKAIVKQVTGMTGLAVAGVNLRIEDVLTPEEVAARNSETEAAAPAPAPALETVEEEEAAEEVVEEGSDA